MFEPILQAIQSHSRIIIHRHANPDGDAIGSQVGLKKILAENFPEKEIYAVGDSAGRFSFVAGSEMDIVPDEWYREALAIILDTSAKALISDSRYALAHATARIDHHLFCEKIADVEVVDTSSESCCGLIAAFAMECGLQVSSLAAKAIYTGMVTDSGRFRYDSTGATTHARASFLMSKGFETGDIYGNLYSDTLENAKLRAGFILRIQLTGHNVAYLYTTKELLNQLGADIFTVSRGMVNTMADLKGVDIWVNFTETDRGVLCELRSSKYNINPIAVKYGGGGHAKASGATVPDRKTAMQMLADLDALTGE